MGHLFLQETHHSSQAESEEWVGKGKGGLRANRQGPSFWSHGTLLFRGVAVLISQSAASRLIIMQLQRIYPDGRSLGVGDEDFTAFAVIAI